MVETTHTDLPIFKKFCSHFKTTLKPTAIQAVARMASQLRLDIKDEIFQSTNPADFVNCIMADGNLFFNEKCEFSRMLIELLDRVDCSELKKIARMRIFTSKGKSLEKLRADG